jgi:hypothetical protein
MKRLLGAAVVFSAMALAETWTGHVIDTMCKGKDAANHTKQCSLGCAKSGFGIVTADGKFIKFDKEGNEKALEAIKATDKEKDLTATVTGSMSGDEIKVESITIQ